MNEWQGAFATVLAIAFVLIVAAIVWKKAKRAYRLYRVGKAHVAYTGSVERSRQMIAMTQAAQDSITDSYFRRGFNQLNSERLH